MLGTFEQAVEAVYRLHVGVVGKGAERHERPHKPVLLLAMLDLIAEGHATPDRIEWSVALRHRFGVYFECVRRQDDQCTPENPFYYLRKEAWWEPLRAGQHGDEALQGPPLVGDAAGGKVFARIGFPMAAWVVNGEDRMRLREAIIARYFPQAKDALKSLFSEGSVQEASLLGDTSIDDDVEPKPGRSTGFRRIILEICDYQCAACGLRIRLPMVEDLTFVDAAHLIPFHKDQNDHPTNGMALCKNHHWAMDRRLIAPHPNGKWVVSDRLKPHRSPGEKELVEMAGREFLPPRDPAFFPAERALTWRVERLLA
jgi:putative restriction endonuclease